MVRKRSLSYTINTRRRLQR